MFVINLKQKENIMKKGLVVDIMGRDCTNHGVTSDKKTAILISNDFAAFPEVFEVDEDSPALEIRPGHGGRQFVAVPAGTPENRYPMFGGHFVYSSDSRFTCASGQPIHVHDRYEA